MKKCKVCYIEKELEGFHKSNRHVDGRLKECRECYNKRIVNMKKTNPEFKEKCLLNSRKSKIKHKDKVLSYNQKYREKNRESLRLKNIQYVKDNKEKVKESKKRYADSNPHMVAKNKVKRRLAEKNAIPEWTDHEKIKIVYQKAKWLGSLTGMKYHVDHIIPLQGKNVCGLHVWSNLQILEASLNCSKQNREDYVIEVHLHE